jgi:hypothetical protein
MKGDGPMQIAGSFFSTLRLLLTRKTDPAGNPKNPQEI